MRLFTVLLYFLQTTLRVADDTLIHHPKHVELSAENIIELYIVASCWTIIENDSRCTELVPTPPRQWTVANTV